MFSIYPMTSITFPMREKKPQQIGNYLLTKKTPKQLKADMNENNHELSDLIIDDPSWESFAWNGVILTSPLMALRGAESLKYLPDGTVIVEPFPRNPDGNLVYKNAKGLYDNKAIRIADIVNQVNKKLLELGKKTITDQSVLSNLKKAAKYLHTAYNLVLRPDSTHMTVTLLNADATDKEIAKWYNQMESRLEKIITLAQHAKNSDFKELKSLPKAQQKFLRCNEAFKLQTGNENE
jgi:hypothetical protein|tara:strand:- start:630 stop:1337 length:708 start_codon:yes stop_codon:yes gene_type:complete